MTDNHGYSEETRIRIDTLDQIDELRFFLRMTKTLTSVVNRVLQTAAHRSVLARRNKLKLPAKRDERKEMKRIKKKERKTVIAVRVLSRLGWLIRKN